MKPVARMTPAAKALIMKNTSFSGLRAGIFLLSNGRLTPSAPATRMDAIEPNLYLSASFLFGGVASSLHVHSPKTIVGRRRRNMIMIE